MPPSTKLQGLPVRIARVGVLVCVSKIVENVKLSFLTAKVLEKRARRKAGI
jgi:hypothetical protein